MVCNQVTGVIRSSCRHVASQLLGTLFLELKLLLNSLFLLPFLGQKIFFLVGCPKPPCFITGAEFLNNSVASLKDQIMNRSHPKAMTIAAVLRGTSSSPSTFNLKNHVLQQFQQHRFNESNPKKKTWPEKRFQNAVLFLGSVVATLDPNLGLKKTDGKNIIRLQKLKIIQHIAGAT